jgi:hypothetical protein
VWDFLAEVFRWIFKDAAPPIALVFAGCLVWLWIRGLHTEHAELRRNHRELDTKNEFAHKDLGEKIDKVERQVSRVESSVGEVKGYVKGLHDK